MLGYHVGDEDEAFRLNSQACFPCPIEVVSERHEDTVLRRAAAVSAHNASVGGYVGSLTGICGTWTPFRQS